MQIDGSLPLVSGLIQPMTMVIRPVTLDGRRIRMEPLSFEPHFEGLMAIGLEPELWKWTINVVETRADLRAYLEEALRMQAEGSALPFATVDKATGKVVGCTRFGNLEPKHLRAEIGWTWVGKEFQRSYVNTEAKYLMLRHAFETWGCRRVELKTNVLNRKSREAMLRIGAKEGGLRSQAASSGGGGWRAMFYYSIDDEERARERARAEEMCASLRLRWY